MLLVYLLKIVFDLERIVFQSVKDCRDSATSDSDIEIDNGSLPDLESVSSDDDMPNIFPNSNEITISDIRSAFTYTELQRHNDIYLNPFSIYNNLISDGMSKVEKFKMLIQRDYVRKCRRLRRET